MATLLLTDALADSIAAAVAQGVPIETACIAARLAPSTVFGWLESARRGSWHNGEVPTERSLALITKFSEQIAAAQAEWEAKQIVAIAEDAESYNAKTGQRDWRARAWLLNNHPRTRGTYHEQKEVEVTRVEPFTELEQAKALPDAELRAEYERLSLPDPGSQA